MAWPKGKKQSAEHRAKLSKSMKGRKPATTGRKRSKETREKISATLSGRKNPHQIHGLSHTPTHTTWCAIKARCANKNDPYYGGRGIKVCKRWEKFKNFLADMGERPSWATGGIDRIDPDGNYTPSNCRWATAKQQRNNQRKRID
jgi:hypothetical protein